MNHITVIAFGAPGSFARRVQENPCAVADLLAATRWVLNDMAYCAPELAAMKYGRWQDRLSVEFDKCGVPPHEYEKFQNAAVGAELLAACKKALADITDVLERQNGQDPALNIFGNAETIATLRTAIANATHPSPAVASSDAMGGEPDPDAKAAADELAISEQLDGEEDDRDTRELGQFGVGS